MYLLVVLLLILETFTAQAQYNMNIRQTVGPKLRYSLCTIDSVWFTIVKPEYVDLGLSVLWATFNVGATAPEDIGDYFAWGETEPYYMSGYAEENPQTHWKDGYSTGYAWSSYKYCNGSNNTMTKYCNNSSYGNKGFTDSLTVLDPEDDLAHMKWGDNWRMPTKAEFKELIDNCTWTWTTINYSVHGYRVTSNKSGYTDRSIFLPAAGYRNDTSLDGTGSSGKYWSSSLTSFLSCNAEDLSFGSDNYYVGSSPRKTAKSVRPVCPSSTYLSLLDSMVLNINELSIIEGYTATISATPLDKDGNAMTAIVGWRSSDSTIASVENGLITAIGAGTCNIIAYIGDIQSTCALTVIRGASGYENGYGYVDLGLSVKWAFYNVGTKIPQGYGKYFAWGETETKNIYSWSNYKHCLGEASSLNKYATLGKYSYNGLYDSKTTLDPEDDAAHINWGGSWRMPTSEEFIELYDCCTWTWTTLNGENGYLVTSNKPGYEDRFIFLPATGYRKENISYVFDNAIGIYWSSSLDVTSSNNNAWCLYFNSDELHPHDGSSRFIGYTVRPVCP